MRLGLGACALMLFCAIAVRHASAQDGSICALLDDDRKRLDCYDLLFKKPLVGGATTSTSEESNNAGPGKSDWLVEQETSKFDDSQNVRVYVLAKDSFVDFLHKRRTPVLTVACHEGEVYAYVVFDTVMQSEPLVYRLDKKSPGKLDVRPSMNHDALGLWTTEEAVAFAMELIGADRLLIRAIPYGLNAVELEFPIAGLAQAIKPLRKACRW